MQPPTSAELDSLRQTRDRQIGEAERLRQDICEHEARIAEFALEAQQYQAAHQPVSLQELLAARQARDGLWQQIRAGAQTLEHAADPYEHLLGESDRLADRRHDTAEEAAALQSKQQELERLRLRLGTARAHVDGIDKALAHAQSHWATRMQALGLSDMTLEQMGPWCTAREQVLSADEHLAEARSELEGLRHRVADADAKLSKALPSAAPAGADLNLNALVRHAADLTEQASRVRTRGDSLREQRDNAAALLATLEDALHQATERLARWQEDWRNCLGALNLPAETGTEAAEQALATLSDMDQHLAKRQELMDARIRPMERDLQRFADAALALAADLDPGLSGSPPADISRVLNERLTQAQRDARDRERLSGEIDEARREAEREARAQTQAKAELQPLLWTPSAALCHRCFRQGPSRTSSGWR